MWARSDSYYHLILTPVGRCYYNRRRIPRQHSLEIMNDCSRSKRQQRLLKTILTWANSDSRYRLTPVRHRNSNRMRIPRPRSSRITKDNCRTKWQQCLLHTVLTLVSCDSCYRHRLTPVGHNYSNRRRIPRPRSSRITNDNRRTKWQQRLLKTILTLVSCDS